MTGNLLWLPAPPETPPPFLRARALLDDGSYLGYTDIRRFGTWRVAEDGAEALLAGKLGPEPLGEWTAADLARALAGRKAPVKAALLDQRVVAGVGNIYADEALFAARVHPAAPAGRLSRARVARVHEAVRAALQAGIDAQGASIRDFRTPDGGYGSAQERFAAYGRGGEPCERCGTPLRRTVIAQRGTTYCPRCQRFYGSGREELGELAARVERAQLAEAADRLLADHDLRHGVAAGQIDELAPEVRLRLDVDVVEGNATGVQECLGAVAPRAPSR